MSLLSPSLFGSCLIPPPSERNLELRDAGSELGFSASSLYKKSPSLLGPQFPLLYNEDLEMIWKGLFHTEPSSSGQFSSVAQ